MLLHCEKLGGGGGGGWWVVALEILLSALGLGVVSILDSRFLVLDSRFSILHSIPRSQVPGPKSQSQSLDNLARTSRRYSVPKF